jgi:similar to spore coat protein
MNTIIEHLTGLHVMTDQVIAMDILNSAKSGVKSYAVALAEAGSPEIKAVLMKQLEEAIDQHEKISAYLIERDLYKPWKLQEQIRMDLTQIQTALHAPGL